MASNQEGWNQQWEGDAPSKTKELQLKFQATLILYSVATMILLQAAFLWGESNLGSSGFHFQIFSLDSDGAFLAPVSLLEETPGWPQAWTSWLRPGRHGHVSVEDGSSLIRVDINRKCCSEAHLPFYIPWTLRGFYRVHEIPSVFSEYSFLPAVVALKPFP